MGCGGGRGGAAAAAATAAAAAAAAAGCGGGSGGRERAARRLRNKKITMFPKIFKIDQTSSNVETLFEKHEKSMIFEELLILGRRRQLLDEKLLHINQLSSLYDPQMVFYDLCEVRYSRWGGARQPVNITTNGA